MASFRKKGSGWNFRISYKEHGKYKTIERGGFLTKKEAQLSAAKLEESLSNGDNFKKQDMLFLDYYTEWFETFKKDKFSEETNRIYQTTINLIAKYFDKVKLKDVNRNNYQDFINRYSLNHSKETVRKINSKFNACFKDALHDNHIPRLPTYRVSLGGLPGKKESEKYISEADSKKLIYSITSNLKVNYVSSYMILLGLASGARFAELLGLTNDCVDFNNNTIKINKTWDYKHLNDFSTTKNEASMRTIEIDPVTMTYLKVFIKAKKTKPINKLVFTDDNGNTISSTAVNKALKRALKRADIDSNMTFHGLRHTHGSLLLLHDTSLIYVSKRLGHSNLETTGNIYSHLVKELQEKGNAISSEVMNSLYA